MSIESLMPSNHLILCRPLLLLPSIFPSIRVFSHELALCIRWPKSWSSATASILTMSIQGWFPLGKRKSKETGWFDLLAIQGTLKSPPTTQFENIDLRHSAFLLVQLSHPYMTTGKTIALTIWTFVDKVMSLLLNPLSEFVTAFLPRSKHLLISWLQSTICIDFGAQGNKVCHCFHCFPICLPWCDAMIFIFE